MPNYHDDSTPAVCDTCLGSNPYVEMKRLRNGATCKICTKPFTVFKWKNSNTTSSGRADLKKTVICLTCSRSKNCCQSCMLDLTFGIDIQTRDKLFKMAKIDSDVVSGTSDIVSNAKNVTSRIYNSNLLEERFKDQEITHLKDSEENLQKIETKLQAVIDSQSFLNIVKKLPFNGALKYYPKDKNINSFFIYGLNNNITKSTISDYFTNLSGGDKSNITSILINTTAGFAFIQFKSRALAESVASSIQKQQKYDTKLPALVIMERTPIRLCWVSSPDNENLAIKFSEEESKKLSNVIKRQMIKISKLESKQKSFNVNHTSKVSKKK